MLVHQVDRLKALSKPIEGWWYGTVGSIYEPCMWWMPNWFSKVSLHDGQNWDLRVGLVRA